MDRETIARIALNAAGITPGDERPEHFLTQEAIDSGDWDTITWDVANDYGKQIGYEIADAIIAAIGTPDATGDLLMRAAETTKIVTSVTFAYSPMMPCHWGVMIDFESASFVSDEGSTPADALRAALKSVEMQAGHE